MIRCIVAAMALAVANGALAQAYPTKPVRVVVPFAPGGATDIVTRLIGQKLGELWNQTVVVDNRGGAGGNIGADIAAKSPADGYTLLMTSGSIVTANPHLYRKMPFDAVKDLVPISMVVSGPQVIAISPSLAPRTVKELIAFAKAKPGSLVFGSAGHGSQTHLAGENFAFAAGIDMTHVPYKGEGPMLTDVMGGQIQFATPNLAASIGFVQQGKVRALAVTSRARAPQLPDVPAVAETLPGFENVGWFGFMVPTGTPKAVIDRVHADTVKALSSADLKSRLEAQGVVAVGNTPAEFARVIREETERWGRIIRERKLQVN